MEPLSPPRCAFRPPGCPCVGRSRLTNHLRSPTPGTVPKDLPPSPLTSDGFGVYDHNGAFADLSWAPSAVASVGTVGDSVRSLGWQEMLTGSNALACLGLAPAGDTEWYAQYGLLPPLQWGVDGGSLLVGDGRPSAEEDVELAGAVHRVNACWMPTMLAALEALLGSDDFFAPHGTNVL